MATYTIYLERLEVVRRAAQVRHVVHSAMEPLVRRAGHELNLVAVPVRAVEDVDASRIDVSLEFVLNRDVANPRDRVLAEQSGHVLVGSILHMRVEAPPRMTCRRAPPSGSPLDARGLECGVEHSGVVERLFQTQDAAFARTVGNIAVHELGHTIAGLDHVRDSENFMFSGASIPRILPPHARTREALRRLWSAPRHFDRRQRDALVDAIRTRTLQGVQTTSGPNSVSP